MVNGKSRLSLVSLLSVMHRKFFILLFIAGGDPPKLSLYVLFVLLILFSYSLQGVFCHPSRLFFFIFYFFGVSSLIAHLIEGVC